MGAASRRGALGAVALRHAILIGRAIRSGLLAEGPPGYDRIVGDSAERAALELMIPRGLCSPNRDRGAHWSRRHRETRIWEQHIVAAALASPATRTAYERLRLIEGERLVRTARGWRVRIERRPARRRVEVTRLIHSRRERIRDADNLAFAVKPLNDALRRLGLIYDDSRRWLEQPLPDEAITVGPPATRLRIVDVGDD